MKSFPVFILILANSLCNHVFGCGPYYPYGDDVRFSIFNPENFNYPEFAPFNYSCSLFGPDDIYTIAGKNDMLSTSYLSNVKLWMKRCDGNVTEKDVYSAIYFSDRTLGFDHLKGEFENPFFNCLKRKNDTAALSYLKFANQCSEFNSYLEDPWERSDSHIIPKRRLLIETALQRSGALNDPDLTQRYAFLAIRMAFYNHDREQLKGIYEGYFKHRKEKNIIDYWALHFYATTEENGPLHNFYVAQVFAFAPDKRYALNDEYEIAVSIDETLKYAVTNKEKEAVWLLDGIKHPGRALENLKSIYALNPSSEAFSFLLLREINKLEDWICTPYYSNFEPSVNNEEMPADEEEDDTPEQTLYQKLQKRIAWDRGYAKDILNLLNSANKEKVENPALFVLAKSYLAFMCKDYDTCLALSKEFGKYSKTNKKLADQNATLKALCLVAKQPDNAAVIPKEIKSLLMRQSESGSNRFIFAVARELEYKGNTTDAAILLANLGQIDVDWGKGAYWKTKKMNSTLYSDFYVGYFFYLDAEYTPDQLNRLISDVKANQKTDSFSIWKYRHITADLSRLYDLCGTKYIRKNDLKNAFSCFGKVSDSLWASYPYSYYLDANPFYTDLYNEHTSTIGDTIRFTKKKIAGNLISYLKKAEDPGNKNRDYYYFLVANCYLNMSYYGNSWLMRRYYWSTAIQESGLEDEQEYYSCDLAKSYYLKAKQYSSSNKFQALSLRMAARCEWYKLLRTNNSYEEDSENTIFTQNKFYSALKSEYPEYYEELTSNCESFGDYFSEGAR